MEDREPRPEPDFRTLFESSPGLYLVLASDFTIVAASDAYLHATNTKREEILGRRSLEILPEKDTLAVSLRRVVDNKASDVMPIQKYAVHRSVAEGGELEERCWSPVNTPVFDADSNVSYVIHRLEDVTALVCLKRLGQAGNPAAELQTLNEVTLETDEELAARVERLIADKERGEQSLQFAYQRLEKLNVDLEHRVRERTAQLEETVHELEAFSYSVSHDLKAPLRAIEGFSRILLEDYAGKIDDEANRLLSVIRSSVSKMTDLIEGLLELAHLGRKHLNVYPINMKSMAESVVDEVRMNSSGRNIEFQTADLHPISGDPILIRQVLTNLISNAVKFTQQRDKAVIEVGSKYVERELIFYVRDNGVGFDMKYANKLFTLFQRLHSDQVFEGTGVGLAIVQRSIHRHGGRVWAEGSVNQGATFFFSIPERAGESVA